MTSTDNLRNALAEAAEAAIKFSSVRATGPLSRTIADMQMEVIGRADLRPAILSGPMNLEVTEGWLQEGNGATLIRFGAEKWGERGLWVRPRSEEATDD